ncbi:MAG: response regulator, partial [Proteobacteria bacterium]|nr:response regulator [Pseudomonadota bacterium]
MSKIEKIPEDFPIKKILVVDDEESLRSLLANALGRAGFSLTQAEHAESAITFLETQSFDLVISDIAMPGMDGVELMKQIKSRTPQTDVIIMTGYGSEYSYVDLMDAGASDYLTKPFKLDSIIARINRIAREKNNLINLKKINQELCMAIERANILAREAKEASKAKTFFLASMSHEIRTPLNGIVGYTDMLLDTPLNDEQKSFLKHARFSCDALLSVVNDILDFSKVEAGRLQLENMAFDPEVLCFDAIDMVRTKVDESAVELIVT